MSFDINKAVAHLVANKAEGPTSHCARYVRQALQAGGIDTSAAPVSAKDYGPFLSNAGFVGVSGADYKTTKGDVAVLQPHAGGSAHGHVAMYDGAHWVSDFQQRDMWGGPGYRKHQPPYVIYRYFARAAAVPAIFRRMGRVLREA
jgi:hypothetical protein